MTKTHGAVLRVTLNRPRALNSLTQGMIDRLDGAFDAAEADDAIGSVFLEGAGDRGFCAGADIVAMRASALAGDLRAEHFLRTEYALNARISEFPKPVIAFMDGVVMGGGVGLSAHASHRLATQRLVCAMPEVTIGFTPDVGASWLLSRAPGELGTHLALTGTSVGAPDAILLGLADCEVASASREGIVAHLADGGEAAAIEHLFGAASQPARLTLEQEWITACYSADDAVEIVGRLAASPQSAARQAAQTILAKSPTSVCVTLAALRRARTLPDLRACLDQELRVSRAFFDQPDLVEGIRAQVVDKDRRPRWSPGTLAEVTPAAVEAYFA